MQQLLRGLLLPRIISQTEEGGWFQIQYPPFSIVRLVLGVAASSSGLLCNFTGSNFSGLTLLLNWNWNWNLLFIIIIYYYLHYYFILFYSFSFSSPLLSPIIICLDLAIVISDLPQRILYGS
ncbi:hypothetical protein SAY87_012542 [Trapa incisa]|uniref:Uncharacterized protein n=1 Tax=Trapa incisa TaxID=236973 RepID=A0AAN7JJW8_9MYRT|nr:hypothetical protein SAY87_012542 [Trapa incisa]